MRLLFSRVAYVVVFACLIFVAFSLLSGIMALLTGGASISGFMWFLIRHIITGWFLYWILGLIKSRWIPFEKTKVRVKKSVVSDYGKNGPKRSIEW